MEDFIRNAFKSLEDLNVIIEPKENKLKEDIEEEVAIENLSVRELFEKEASYIITHDFEYAGHSYSLFLEALHEGESCDIEFEEFDINNIDSALIEVLDSEHDFLGSLTGENITLDTSMSEVLSDAHRLISGEDEEIVVTSDEHEEEANERIFVNGDPDEVSVEAEIEEPVKEEVLNESQSFDLNDAEEVKEADKIMKKDSDDTIEQIVDASAESKEDLKKSYVGSIILQCPTCKAMMYKDPDQLVKVEGEEELYNVDEECPHCGAKDGFEIVGQVASLDVDPEAEPVPPMVEEEPVEVETETEVEEVPVEEPVDLISSEETNEDLEPEESDKKEKEEAEESEDDEVEDKEEEPLNEEVPVEEYTADEIFEAADSSLKHSGDSVAIQLKDRVFVCDTDDLPEGGVPKDGNFEFVGCEVLSKDIGKLDDGSLFMEDTEPEKHYIVKDGIVEEKVEEKCEGEECKEEKQVCPKCGKEVCECSKVEEEKKEGELKLESFDEDKFDKLVTRYLKETYFNVKSYKTTAAGLNDAANKVVMEGLVTFKSGKTKPTKFVFEAKELNAKKQLKLVGINEMFSTSKAFTLVGTVENNKLLSESLSYRYNVGDKKVRGKAESFRKR